MKKLKLKKPEYFCVRLSKCGIESLNGTYKIFKGTNALKLLEKSCVVIAKDFVGEKRMNYLLYDLACTILNELTKNKKALLKDIDNTKELDKIWELKK